MFIREIRGFNCVFWVKMEQVTTKPVSLSAKLKIMNTTSASRSSRAWPLLGLALLLLLPGLTGCIALAAGAGAGAVAYVTGELKTTLTSDYSKVVESTRVAIKDLEFSPVSENKDAYSAVLVARTAHDKKVKITLTSEGKMLTNIKIRVGILGDQQLSLTVLDKIKAGL